MPGLNRRQVWFFGLIVLSVIATVTIGLLTNILTADPNKLFAPERCRYWGLLGVAMILLAVFTFWMNSPASKAEGSEQDQGTETPSSHPALSPEDLNNRRALRDKVHNSWIDGVLNKSLYSKARIALGLEERPDAVHPWAMEWKPKNQPKQVLPAETRLWNQWFSLIRICLQMTECGFSPNFIA